MQALIFTTKGNIPVDSLERTDGWVFEPNQVTYWEQYKLEEEIVKRNVAVFQVPSGTTLQLKQQSLG